jgi:hypothetical protein
MTNKCEVGLVPIYSLFPRKVRSICTAANITRILSDYIYNF